jgi:cupin fold WbuC family metalloprotein
MEYGTPMAEIEHPQHVGEQQLIELLAQAAGSARRRSNLLLHANHQDQVQRLLIALEADSYIRTCTANNGRCCYCCAVGSMS